MQLTPGELLAHTQDASVTRLKTRRSTVKEEDDQNQELLQFSHQILELTKRMHASASSASRLSNEKED
jgi:hypothetical protein